MAIETTASTIKHTLRSAKLAAALSVVVAALVGCQPKSEPVAVRLPPPSFDGPKVIASPAAPKSAPVASGLSGPAAWSPKAPARPWKWIVIHHSASPSGSMAVFDKEHKSKGWDGIGYHFVIGNGTNTGDGQIEVTPRWPAQKWGAHAKTVDNRFNEYGIGICLVGNFDVERPTPKQMASLTKLTGYLMQAYRVSPQNIVGHRDTKATECPGRFVNLALIRQSAAKAVAEAGGRIEPDKVQTAAGGELLQNVRH
jgi:hypothetical protein